MMGDNAGHPASQSYTTQIIYIRRGKIAYTMHIAELKRCFSIVSFSLCQGLQRQFFSEEVNLSIQYA